MSNQKGYTKMEIIEEIDKVVISSTQEIRVLLVRDPELGTRVSLQKWWRPGENAEWRIGKGFLLDGRQSLIIGDALKEVGANIVHIKN